MRVVGCTNLTRDAKDAAPSQVTEIDSAMFRVISISLMMMCTSCATVPVATADSSEPYVYKLGAGDRLKISVFGEPSLSGEYAVDGAGAIAYPLLGQVTAASKTTSALRQEIENRLGGQYVREPKVSVEVANYRPIYVLGEVARPGEFPYVEGITAYALVAKAGGFTYRANQKVIFIRRESMSDEQAYALSGRLTIRPGDTVRVGERYF